MKRIAFLTLNFHFMYKYNLNMSELILTAYYFDATWAKIKRIDDEEYYFISRTKVVEDMPALSEKPDTIYRITKSLAEKGIIKYTKLEGKDYIAINRAKAEEYRKMSAHEFESVLRKEIQASDNESKSVQTPEKSDSNSNSGRIQIRHTDSYTITDSYDNTESDSEIKNFAHTQEDISFDENGNQITNDSLTEKTKRKQTGRAAFVPPSVGEVYDEAIQKGLTREEARFESSQFVNYYESIGWVSGKKKIVSWKAAFAGWLNRSAKWNKERAKTSNTGTNRNDDYADVANISINSLIK